MFSADARGKSWRDDETHQHIINAAEGRQEQTMSRGRSGHGGSITISKTTLEWLSAFSEFCGAALALDDAGGKGPLGKLTVEQTARLKAAVGNGVGEIAKALQAFTDGLAAWEAVQPEIEAKIEAAAAAEQRLSRIGTSVAAKEERMALLAQEEDRLSSELATRRSELATVEGKLAKYREQIAAL